MLLSNGQKHHLPNVARRRDPLGGFSFWRSIVGAAMEAKHPINSRCGRAGSEKCQQQILMSESSIIHLIRLLKSAIDLDEINAVNETLGCES